MAVDKDLPGRFLLEVKVGDRVHLMADGNFFRNGIPGDEEYFGFVAGLTEIEVTLSTTPNTNMHHGYTNGNYKGQRAMTPMVLERITEYEIL